MDTIAKRVLGTRKAKGITQGDIASALGISINNVSKWERGLAEPRKPEHIEKLAKLLGVSKVYLMFGEEYLEDEGLSLEDKIKFLTAENRELAVNFIEMLVEKQSNNRGKGSNGNGEGT